MDPEERKLLEETHRLAEENNGMLRSIKRSMRISSIVRGIYWLFIIGSAIGAIYLLQPYIDQFKEVYEGATSTYESIRNFGQ